MHITFSKIELPKSGVVVILLPQGKKKTGTLARLDKRTKGAVARAIKTLKFKGKAGKLVELLAPAGTPFSRIVIYGIGDLSKLHPRDIDDMQPRLPLSLMRRFKSYVGLVRTLPKLAGLLEDFRWMPFRDYVWP